MSFDVLYVIIFSPEASSECQKAKMKRKFIFAKGNNIYCKIFSITSIRTISKNIILKELYKKEIIMNGKEARQILLDTLNEEMERLKRIDELWVELDKECEFGIKRDSDRMKEIFEELDILVGSADTEISDEEFFRRLRGMKS